MPTKQDKNPSWLSSLENKSFEVELLVSGLAIYGALALEGFLIDLSGQWILSFNDNVLFLLQFVFIYLFFAQKILLFCLIFHFVARILWIGMVGLNSVFPDGINGNNTNYPRHINDRILQDYPDSRAYTLKLDRLCSTIFAFICAAIIALIMIAFWLFVIIGISEMLRTFLPNEFVYALQILFLVLFYLLIMALGLLPSYGPYVDSDFSKKYGYRIMDGMTRGIYLFFSEPISYIVYTIRTNIKSKQGILLMLLLFVAIVVSSKTAIQSTKYYDSSFFYSNSNPSEVSKNNYEDQFEGKYSYFPMIQSEIIKNDRHLKVFIPFLVRERTSKEMICGKYELADSLNLDKVERRIHRERFDENCAKQYYQIFIDNGLVDKLELRKRKHFRNDQLGYQAIIPIDSLQSGHHLLKIRLGYTSEVGENALRIIPFYKD